MIPAFWGGRVNLKRRGEGWGVVINVPVGAGHRNPHSWLKQENKFLGFIRRLRRYLSALETLDLGTPG